MMKGDGLNSGVDVFVLVCYMPLVSSGKKELKYFQIKRQKILSQKYLKSISKLSQKQKVLAVTKEGRKYLLIQKAKSTC